MILYVGPDQVIPLTGLIGTAIGLILIFWGKLLQGFRRVANLFSKSSGAPEDKTDT